MRLRLLTISLAAVLLAGCGSDEADSPPPSKGKNGASGKGGAAGASGASGQAGAGASGASGAGGGSGEGGAGGGAGAAGSPAGAGGSAGSGGGAGGEAGAGGAQGGSAGSAGECPPPGDCGDVGINGACVGGMLRYCVPTPPDTCDPPKLVEKACDAGESCVVENGSAFCKATSACKAGDAFCGGDDGNTLFSCKADGSGYDQTPCDAGFCDAAVGKPAQCLDTSNAGGVNHTLSGCITFEFRNMDKTGPTNIDFNVAYYAHVGVYNDGKFLGKAITGPDGCFVAKLSEEPTTTTDVFIYPYDADPATGKGRLAVLKNTTAPTDKGPYVSSEYWQWSNKTVDCGEGLAAPVIPDPTGLGNHTIGFADHNNDGKFDLVIRESCGSGAMQIYNWVRYAMRKLGDPVDGLAATKDKPQTSLGIIWSPSKDVFCGACYAPKTFGGVTVTPADGPPEKFDTVMMLSGSKQSPKHWSKAVIAHEAGHWVMENYSKLPGEGGPHDADKIYSPGRAYFEGWATAFGLDLISNPANDDFPLYIDTDKDGTFWIDVPNLQRGRLDKSAKLPLPTYEGPLEQNLNEYVVADMIWQLWQAKGPGSNIYVGLGAEKTFKAFRSQRLTGTVNRGYKTVDLVDFFDAVLCENLAKSYDIEGIAAPLNFPYLGAQKVCAP